VANIHLQHLAGEERTIATREQEPDTQVHVSPMPVNNINNNQQTINQQTNSNIQHLPAIVSSGKQKQLNVTNNHGYIIQNLTLTCLPPLPPQQKHN